MLHTIHNKKKLKKVWHKGQQEVACGHNNTKNQGITKYSKCIKIKDNIYADKIEKMFNNWAKNPLHKPPMISVTEHREKEREGKLKKVILRSKRDQTNSRRKMIEARLPIGTAHGRLVRFSSKDQLSTWESLSKDRELCAR